MLRRYDWALDCHEGCPWDPGASQGIYGVGHEHRCSHLAAPSGVLSGLFSGLVSTLGAIHSFFMLPNLTAIMIMLGNCAIYSSEDKILDSKLQSPSLGTPGLPCLPGHWVGRGRGCGHPKKVGGHPEWREKHLHCRECVQEEFQGLSRLILFR